MAEENATLVLPPRHPRVPQLINLERSRMQQLRELKAIEKECEVAAEPFAIEIEKLEGKEAEIVTAADAAATRRAEIQLAQEKHREVQARIMEERAAQDARLKAESERMEAELAELDAGDIKRGSELAAVRADVRRAREGFDRARTTSKGRAIEHKISKIEKQQQTIVARNPGARFFRLEIGINAEADRLGLRQKVEAVANAIRTDKFGSLVQHGIRELRQSLQAEPSDFEVRLLALRVLAEMSVPTEDTEIRVVYRPPNVTVEAVGLSDSARARCLAAIAAASDAPARAEPGAAEGAASAGPAA